MQQLANDILHSPAGHKCFSGLNLAGRSLLSWPGGHDLRMSSHLQPQATNQRKARESSVHHKVQSMSNHQAVYWFIFHILHSAFPPHITQAFNWIVYLGVNSYTRYVWTSVVFKLQMKPANGPREREELSIILHCKTRKKKGRTESQTTRRLQRSSTLR